MDFHVLFKTGKFSKCEVFFGKTECSGTKLDSNNYLGGKKGVEAITVNTIGNFNYSLVVHKYNGKKIEDSNKVDGAPVLLPQEEDATNIPNLDLNKSLAKVSVYAPGLKRAIKELEVPYIITDENYLDKDKDKASQALDWWLAFCIDGKQGLSSLLTANKISSSKPDYAACEKLYDAAAKKP